MHLIPPLPPAEFPVDLLILLVALIGGAWALHWLAYRGKKQ